MSLLDPQNIIFTSEQAVDKIVRIFTGSYDGATQTAVVHDVWCYAIAHGLNRPVACDLLWSADGTTWHDANTDHIAFSDSTNVYIWHTPRYGTAIGPAAGTVYYKLYANWIDDYDTTNPLVTVQQYGDTKKQFDSRANYQKIYLQGAVTANTTLIHTLGYAPNAKGWIEAFSGEAWPLNAGGASNPLLVDSANQAQGSIAITATGVTLSIDKPGKRLWYRIYYDKA